LTRSPPGKAAAGRRTGTAAAAWHNGGDTAGAGRGGHGPSGPACGLDSELEALSSERIGASSEDLPARRSRGPARAGPAREVPPTRTRTQPPTRSPALPRAGTQPQAASVRCSAAAVAVAPACSESGGRLRVPDTPCSLSARSDSDRAPCQGKQFKVYRSRTTQNSNVPVRSPEGPCIRRRVRVDRGHCQWQKPPRLAPCSRGGSRFKLAPGRNSKCRTVL
jgi:hypothetical protein